MKKIICRIVKYLIDILNEVYTWCHTTIAAPTLLTATVVPPNIDLAWIDNSNNEDGFNIWRSEDGTNFTQIDTVPANTTTYTDTTATPGQEYWYEVNAYNATDTSNFSNIVNTGLTFTDINLGLIYNWFAINGSFAPTGWHIPTIAEFNTLQATLGGSLVAGGKLKETGLTYWDSPNTGADNSSGFTGRGAGTRNSATGAFQNIKLDGYFWSITEYLGTRADYMQIYYNSTQTNTTQIFFKQQGASVRIIKDDSTDPGLVSDYDGNIYQTVKIGTQVWITSNFICKHYTDGTPIPEEQNAGNWAALATGAWCYYNNDPNNM